jgi:hypothetical protein
MPDSFSREPAPKNSKAIVYRFAIGGGSKCDVEGDVVALEMLEGLTQFHAMDPVAGLNAECRKVFPDDLAGLWDESTK